MGTIEVNGKKIEVDDDGYLVNPEDWDLDVANYYAQAEGVELGPEHWDVVTFLREYYQRCKRAPMLKILANELGKQFGPEKGTVKYLYELFPSGPAKQACRIAGLPRPTGCV